MAISAIRQNIISGSKSKWIMCLAMTFALHRDDFDVITFPGGSAQAAMNSPSTTSFARFAHSTGIDKVQVGRTGRGRGQGPLRKQRTAKLAWPNPALAQSFQKGHIRQIGQLRVLGANNGFAQRKTATQMHQQNAQIACFRFILGESPKRAGSFRLHSPIRWKEGHQHFPIFSQTIGVIVFHAANLLHNNRDCQ